MTYSPYRENNPPLTPAQEAVRLESEGPRRPATPEEWSLRACESMQAISDAVRYKFGSYPSGRTGYRPIDPQIPGIQILFVDTGPDDYELRIQPNVELPPIPEDATIEDVARINKEAQDTTPEYRWSNLQAHKLLVQLRGQQQEVGAMSLEQAEVHGTYLRQLAVFAVTEMGDEETLATLTATNEHQENAPLLPEKRDPIPDPPGESSEQT